MQSGGFGSLTATTCSLGRMVSGYLEALEGAATLSAYVDAEFLAVVELTKGMAKVSGHILLKQEVSSLEVGVNVLGVSRGKCLV